MNNHLDHLVRQTAQDAAREATKAEIKAFASQVRERVQDYLSRPTADEKAALVLSLISDILAEASGLPTNPPMVPLQKRKKGVTTRDLIWAVREREAAEKLGVSVWVKSESDGDSKQ